MTALASPPIPTDASEGGALNWFDLQDSQGCVRIILVGKPVPTAVEEHQKWVRKALDEAYGQSFFFVPRALSKAPMRFHLEKICNENGVGSALLCLPLTHLFLLPDENPTEELTQMKAFLTWLDERLQGQNQDGDDATICWARVGKVDLQAMYFKDKDAGETLESDLKAWRQQPWFEAWHQANATALKRLSRGRHFWFDLASLVPSRRAQRLRALHASNPPTLQPDHSEDRIVLDI